jgi:ATP-dependent Clp protease ATP-binding subunit ClpB
VIDALRQQFRPEFINRVDEIIVFHALGREHLREIVDIQLRSLMKRLEDRKIHFDITDRAKDLLIEEGYDPIYGARPLKRTIQREILDPLAMRVLQGDFVEGDVVSIDATSGEIAFAKAKSLQHA